MGRPATRGLDYTFLDKNFFFDRKVKRLKRKCGDDAPYAFLALLCLITPEGYYIKYDNDTVYDIADMTGFDEERVARILDTCGEIGLLDEHLMLTEHVLTSHGIQKYYANTCLQLKRKFSVDEYSLLVSSEETPDNTPEQGVSSEETPKNGQNPEFLPKISEEMPTKVCVCVCEEDSKVEESKEEDCSFSSSSSPSPCVEVAPSEEDEEKEKYLSFMFFQDWEKPGRELEEFIAFNNVGGRSWDKMSPVERQSALLLWGQKPPKPPRLGKNFLELWQVVYDVLVEKGAPLGLRMDALSDGIRWTIEHNKLTLYCSERLAQFIERNMDRFKPHIMKFLHAGRYEQTFKYHFIPPWTKKE